MTWNHRVIAYTNMRADVHFIIEEVYYSASGEPQHHSQGASIGGDSIKDLTWIIEKMQSALDKPILSADNFPEEYKPEYKTT